jgi:hypothetical protein
VSLLSVLPDFRPEHSIAWIGPSAIFLGVSMLASLGFGYEFQNRTLPHLLAQPVDRMELWREKFVVGVAAVATAVLIFAIATENGGSPSDAHGWPLAVVIFTALTASATFWTLLAGTAVGGCVLSIAAIFTIIFALTSVYWLCGARDYWAMAPTFPGVSAFVLLIYAGATLWLGRRTLERFQVTEGTAEIDLAMAGPHLLPQVLAGWLRCRPRGVVLNLFRKEIRLLRPVWLASLLAAAAWTGLILFGFLHKNGATNSYEMAIASLGVISTAMIAPLAGFLPLAEERKSGMHATNMTLPAPAFLQWRIKLYTALFAGFTGAWLLPAVITGRLFGRSHVFMDVQFGTAWLVGVLLLTFAGFWFACSKIWTEMSWLWAFPAMIAVWLVPQASNFGETAGNKVMDLYVARFDPFASFKAADGVVSWFWVAWRLRAPGIFIQNFSRLNRDSWPILVMLWAPVLLLAIIQSYRRFREQIQNNALSLVRNLLYLAMVAFLCSLAVGAFFDYYRHAYRMTNSFEKEIFQAIDGIRSDTLNRGDTHLLQLAEEDISRASPLSASTRRWLRNSRITVVPMRPLRRTDCCTGNLLYRPFNYDDPQLWCLVTIHLEGATDCTSRLPIPYPKSHKLVVLCR